MARISSPRSSPRRHSDCSSCICGPSGSAYKLEFHPCYSSSINGPLGGLLTNRLYDDKIMSQDEYKFDGVKGGDQWKGRCRRYFMAKVPALRVLMAWCESADDKTVTDNICSGQSKAK